MIQPSGRRVTLNRNGLPRANAANCVLAIRACTLERRIQVWQHDRSQVVVLQRQSELEPATGENALPGCRSHGCTCKSDEQSERWMGHELNSVKYVGD